MMKKLLCLILVCLVCLTCLVACFDETPSEVPGGETGGTPGGEAGGTPGDEPVKELTKAEVVAGVNETIKKLNETDFSKIDTDEMFGTSDVWSDLMQQVKENPWELSVRSDTTANGLLCAQKDGMLYIVQPTKENGTYIALLQDAFVMLSQNEESRAWEATYYLLSSLLNEVTGGSTILSEEADFDFSSLSFTFPPMTEEDLTVDGQIFTVSNAYLVKVGKAILDAIPADALPDDGTLATIKTMLPGMVENLNLKISFAIEGDAIIGFSLSFDANRDFCAMFWPSPDSMVMRGSFAFYEKAVGEQPAGLFVDLELTDIIDMTLSATVAPATAKAPETFSFVMNGTLFDAKIASKNGHHGNYELYGDMQIDVDIKIAPSAFLTDAKDPIKATITVTPSNLSMRASIAAEEGEASIEDIFGDDMAAPTSFTLSSAATGKKETTFTLICTNGGGEGSTWKIDLVLLRGSAPSFQSMPTEAAKLLDEKYAPLYKELLMAAVEASVEENVFLFGDFGYTTEDGSFLSFFFGVNNGRFTVTSGAHEETDYILTKKDGQYVVSRSYTPPFMDKEYRY